MRQATENESMVCKLPGAGAPSCAPGPSPVEGLPRIAPGARLGEGSGGAPDDALLDIPFEEVVRRRLRPVIATLSEGAAGGTIFREVLDQVERVLMGLALDCTGGNQQRAASVLGISRNTLRAKWSGWVAGAAANGNGRGSHRAGPAAQRSEARA